MTTSNSPRRQRAVAKRRDAERRLWSLLRSQPTRAVGALSGFQRRTAVGDVVVGFLNRERRLLVALVDDDADPLATRKSLARRVDRGIRIEPVAPSELRDDPDRVLARIVDAATSPLSRPRRPMRSSERGAESAVSTQVDQPTTRAQQQRATDAEAYGGYNFAYLDENTKRMIRRAILKAVAIPGYQVPFASREMPMPYGWGTGGVQVTAACLTPSDVLKVIDQGADDTTNAVSLRQFFEKTAGVATTTETASATLIQTRHRIPEQALSDGQILVYQVPIPEPLRFLEPRETETRKMHALEEYGLMHVKLYEDIARHGRIATTYAYPVKVGDRYVMDPSPIPKFDNPKLSDCPALQLFGAGREQRIYALPPYTPVKSLDFDDYPFDPGSWEQCCALCGAEDSYLDEIITDDSGGAMFVCSDTDFCEKRRAAGHVGPALARSDA